jgi:hypothetical protein
MPVQNGTTRQGVIFNISGQALKRVLDGGGDVAALARQSVMNRLKEFQDNGIDIYLTEKQIDMIVWRLVYAAQNNWKKQYYNVQHSLFTEVYDMDDYLEHHGVLGMKWGVRRYQNEDGTLTEEGKKRYTKKDGSYIDNESRQAIKKEISKRKGMAGASSVLGSALISSVILNPAVLAMPVAGLVLPAAIAATSAASLINNVKSMQLSQIKDRADMIDFHRSGNEPVEPIRVNVRRR